MRSDISANIRNMSQTDTETLTKGELLFDGNEKRVYATEDPEKVIFHFKDVATAYNNIKKAVFPEKGVVSNRISSLLFAWLEENGVYTHFISELGDREQLCRKSRNIPLELKVRNYFAGSAAGRLGIEDGTKARTVIFDLNYNNDELGDPMVNDYHILAMGWCSAGTLSQIKDYALRINDYLVSYFRQIGIDLIDFKLEFGITNDGKLVLADEISPDTCRFWDSRTHEKLDKDRFRRDLGNVEGAYREVLSRVFGDRT